MAGSTLAAVASHVLEVKKSRFLAQAAPVASPGEALAFLARAADAGATHNCWAYRVGDQYRFADDGEPGGTAGRPILAAIDGQELDAVMVVVTRWYGGVKLGAGGLVRAYGGAAAECLRSAPREPLVHWLAAEVRCGFAFEQPLRALLAEHGAEVGEPRYAADGLLLPVRIRADERALVAARVLDASRGSASLRLLADTPSAT